MSRERYRIGAEARAGGRSARRRKPARGGLLARLALAPIGAIAALVAAELVVRWSDSRLQPAHESYLLTAEGQPATLAGALARGEAELGPPPRRRPRWVEPVTWFICYRGGDGPSMDARGCVRVDINALGLRDRPGLTRAKPAGHERILCLGDSFTFGWGVARERTWVRLIEPLIPPEQAGHEVRTVNCGLAGTLLIDEAWWALRDRWFGLDPDFVLMTVCLNDLVPMPDTVALFRSSTLPSCAGHGGYLRWECAACVAAARAEQRERDGWWAWLGFSELYRMLRGAVELRRRTDLDPGVDWGRWLLEMPADWPLPLPDAQGRFRTAYELQGFPPEATWRAGAPQQALRKMRDACAARGVPFAVVVWPLLQGLEAGAVYPFETLHRVLGELCAAEGIPLLDLLPTLRSRPAESLWVDPSDMHPNALAHALAAPVIAQLVVRVRAR